MLTFYLVAYATLQMYDIRTNSQSVLLKRISNKFNFFLVCVLSVTFTFLCDCNEVSGQWGQLAIVHAWKSGYGLKSWHLLIRPDW